MDKEDSFDSVCLLEKRNYELFATVGRNGAFSVPMNTVLGSSAKPHVIHKKALTL